MDAEEREICDFLKSYLGQYVAGREICRRAGGKWRFREDPVWAIPVLTRMVEKGYLEADAGGHFRIRPPERKGKEAKKVWLSPEMQDVLERGRKGGGGDAVVQDLSDYEDL